MSVQSCKLRTTTRYELVISLHALFPILDIVEEELEVALFLLPTTGCDQAGIGNIGNTVGQ